VKPICRPSGVNSSIGQILHGKNQHAQSIQQLVEVPKKAAPVFFCISGNLLMESVFGQAEEVEHLSGGIEPNLTGFLPEGEHGNPYRDEAVLAKGRPNCG